MHNRKKYKVKLDNTAIIHMASHNKSWLNIFRLSITLKEEIHPAILQEALNVVTERFPTIAARISKGIFWYYLEPVYKAPIIEKDTKLLKYMSKKDLYKSSFRVLYSEKSIHVELFHSLTDGKGGMVFLKSLVYEYLKRKEGLHLKDREDILDTNEHPSKDEIADNYKDIKIKQKNKVTFKNNQVYQLKGKTINKLKTEKYIIDIVDIKKIAKDMNISLTVLVASMIIMGLINLQKEEMKTQSQKDIKIFLPIDLRNMFHKNTLRNFVLYMKPQINPKVQDYTLNEIIKIIDNQLKSGLSEDNLRTRIQKNVSIQNSIFIKMMPLFIKQYFLKRSFLFSEKTTCLTLSNLGLIRMPMEMDKYIDRVDCILNTRSRTPYNCSMLSYDNKLYINLVRDIEQPLLELEINKLLKQLNIKYEVESNEY